MENATCDAGPPPKYSHTLYIRIYIYIYTYNYVYMFFYMLSHGRCETKCLMHLCYFVVDICRKKAGLATPTHQYSTNQRFVDTPALRNNVLMRCILDMYCNMLIHFDIRLRLRRQYQTCTTSTCDKSCFLMC